MRYSSLGLFAALISVLGCAALKPAPRPKDPGLFLLSPSEAGRELSLQQQLRFSRGKAVFEAVAAIEIDRQSMRLAALGPLGNRMLSLVWDGKNYSEEKDPRLPKELPLKLILRDIQLAYFPAEALQKNLPAGWTLKDGPKFRSLESGGEEIIRIRYDGSQRWNSPLIFEHLGLGYHLEVQPINNDEPNDEDAEP